MDFGMAGKVRDNAYSEVKRQEELHRGRPPTEGPFHPPRLGGGATLPRFFRRGEMKQRILAH
ncbi:MAG TPA: hypothetical protein DCS42_04385 [Nitrospiraceae bacterium]|nr:hypothetical protein [Nitrospiraceae bacterium]